MSPHTYAQGNRQLKSILIPDQMVQIKSLIQSNGGDGIGMLPLVNPEGTPSKTSEVDSPTCKSGIGNRDTRFHFITYDFSELQTPNNSEIGSRNYLNDHDNSCPFQIPNSEQFGNQKLGLSFMIITTLCPFRTLNSELHFEAFNPFRTKGNLNEWLSSIDEPHPMAVNSLDL